MERTEQVPQVEQGTENVASQPETTEVLPSPEELQKEIGRKEAVIQDVKKELREARKQGIPKELLDTLQKRLDGMEESNADLFDYVVDHLGEGDAEKPVRKTRRQQLDEKRAIPSTPTAEPVSPDVRRFIDYMEDQGMSEDDDLVKEAIADEKSPKEALKYLKGKIAERGQAGNTVDIAREVEKKLKEMGVTASGAGAPSSSGENINALTPDEKLQRGFEKLKEKK